MTAEQPNDPRRRFPDLNIEAMSDWLAPPGRWEEHTAESWRDHRAGCAEWAETFWHGKEWMQVLLADPCPYCGERSAQVDHITPSSRDGLDHWTNWAGACRSCNASKGNRSMLFQMARRWNLREQAKRWGGVGA